MAFDDFETAFPVRRKRTPWLAITQEAIVKNTIGRVKLCDTSGVTVGGDLRAANLGDIDVAIGKFVHLGEDVYGNPFFSKRGADTSPPIVCDCSGATSFEECWDMGWQQGVSSLGGGFKTRAFWTLLSGGTPVVGCEALAQALGNCNGPNPPPNLTWQLDLLTEGTFGGVPYSHSGGPFFLDNYPYVPGFLGSPVLIPTPWGDLADAETSPKMGLWGCNNSFDSIDFFGATRIGTTDICESWDGTIPCSPGDPRPECINCI